MNESTVFALLRDVAMIIVTVLVFFWGRDRKQVADAIEQRFVTTKAETVAAFALRDLRLDGLERRLDRAAEESSKQSSRVMTEMGRLEIAQRVMAQDIVRLQERGDRRKG